jgi:hypothetical protein
MAEPMDALIPSTPEAARALYDAMVGVPPVCSVDSEGNVYVIATGERLNLSRTFAAPADSPVGGSE